MNLLSTTLWSALATALRLGSGLIVAKMVALAGGPASLAVFGQFQNFLILITGISGALFQAGIVKYAAQHRDNNAELSGMLATAIKLSMMIALCGSLLMIIFHAQVAQLVLHQSNWSGLFLLAGFVLPMLVTNGISLAFLNGMGQIRHYLMLNALTALINMLTVVGLSLWMGIDGALYALCIGPILSGIVSVGYTVRTHGAVLVAAWRLKIDKVWVKHFSQFALMSITALITSTMLPMGIRNELALALSWQEAGYWQATWQLSGAYLGVITAGFSVYYLPKLSRLTVDKEIRQEMLTFYRSAMPIVLLLGGLVFVLRAPLLQLLYSDKFLPAAELVGWQITGDMFKIAAWVLSYMMVAKKMTAWFVGSEIIFASLIYLANIWLIPLLGVQAPVIIYACAYALYFGFIYLLIGRGFYLLKDAHVG